MTILPITARKCRFKKNMKINELRIGNLVTDRFYDSFKTIIKVSSINEIGINLQIEDDGRWLEIAQRWISPEYEIKDLCPIPLSEELLLKSDFIECNGKYGKYYNHLQCEFFRLWRHEDGSFVVGKKDEYLELTIQITNVKYLHKLQNVFFDLTNEELKINL